MIFKFKNKTKWSSEFTKKLVYLLKNAFFINMKKIRHFL